MTVHYLGLAEQVARQQVLRPDIYARIDFEQTPYRFTTDPSVKSALPHWVARREPYLANESLVELMRTATMLGDVVADSYAALLPKFGVRGLVEMLKQACREGVDAVPDAPEELRAFIADMEATPDWVDLDYVELGAKHARVSAAYLSPFIIRGAFIATFLNSYSALPMTITGALSGTRAAHRVNDTTSFFSVTTLPGALQRHGVGFQSAAMVRLMHSVVRYNALVRSDVWDTSVYGMPVPQVDQMPAGLINVYILSVLALRRGRNEFNEREKAMLAFTHYRNFLLGVPAELLPDTPRGIIDVFYARAACLRDDFDDSCRELVTSTMDAYLRADQTWFDRAADRVEKAWSTVFVLGINGGDRNATKKMGVRVGASDVGLVAATAPFVLGRFISAVVAGAHPVLLDRLDVHVTGVVERRLATSGHPEFTTDPDSYPQHG
ncbi:MAG TPA: oxygenase MpaB family protein [Aeromicrobium sp.]|nr:oxygenase MpaB family protein [Aeromicrobium sp.]